MSRSRARPGLGVTWGTTWRERFVAALALLAGGQTPPAALVDAWFANTDEALQSWAATHTTLPWAQGIAVIDAAMSLADHPAEGEDHHPRTPDFR